MQASESERLDLVFGALANPVRRSILDNVSDGDRTVLQLAAPHSMSLNAVSKHIKVLERAGLVQRRVDGSYHRISINREAMEQATAWLAHYTPFWNDTLRRLKTTLEAK